jgi:hypothetical protein
MEPLLSRLVPQPKWERIRASEWRSLTAEGRRKLARRLVADADATSDYHSAARLRDLLEPVSYHQYLLRAVEYQGPRVDVTSLLLQMSIHELLETPLTCIFRKAFVLRPIDCESREALMERLVTMSRHGIVASRLCGLDMYDCLVAECMRRPQWFYEVARMIIAYPLPEHMSYIRHFVDISRPLLLITDEGRARRATQEHDVVSAILFLYPYALDSGYLTRTMTTRLDNWDAIELLDIAYRRRGTNDLGSLARFILFRCKLPLVEKLVMLERLGVTRDTLVGNSLITLAASMAPTERSLHLMAWLYREGCRPTEATLAETTMFSHPFSAVLTLDKGVDLTGLTRRVEKELGRPLVYSSDVIAIPVAIRRQQWEKAGSPAALERFVTDEDEDQLRRRGLLWDEEEEILVKPAASRAPDDYEY